ncbi:hypothetical protein DRO30_00055 [Candidatus Bathyarchaeota archaeon]|nr:MAG: hypothetical protein DRO30_00055 [Candidatus Bathyarchaeota archaeon]
MHNNNKIVFVFDVDGTLECGNPKGPIKLRMLKRMKDKGFIVGIVGAYEKVQPYIKNLDFYFGGDPHKPENMRRVREKFNPFLGFYIADLPRDRIVALENGFCYIKPEDFKLMEE